MFVELRTLPHSFYHTMTSELTVVGNKMFTASGEHHRTADKQHYAHTRHFSDSSSALGSDKHSWESLCRVFKWGWGKESQDSVCCNILACPLALTFYLFPVGHKFTDNRQAFKSLDHVLYTWSWPNHKRIALKDRSDCSSRSSMWEWETQLVTNLLKRDFPCWSRLVCAGLAQVY